MRAPTGSTAPARASCVGACSGLQRLWTLRDAHGPLGGWHPAGGPARFLRCGVLTARGPGPRGWGASVDRPPAVPWGRAASTHRESHTKRVSPKQGKHRTEDEPGEGSSCHETPPKRGKHAPHLVDRVPGWARPGPRPAPAPAPTARSGVSAAQRRSVRLLGSQLVSQTPPPPPPRSLSAPGPRPQPGAGRREGLWAPAVPCPTSWVRFSEVAWGRASGSWGSERPPPRREGRAVPWGKSGRQGSFPHLPLSKKGRGAPHPAQGSPPRPQTAALGCRPSPAPRAVRRRHSTGPRGPGRRWAQSPPPLRSLAPCARGCGQSGRGSFTCCSPTAVGRDAGPPMMSRPGLCLGHRPPAPQPPPHLSPPT